jgi:hypothetical protein
MRLKRYLAEGSIGNITKNIAVVSMPTFTTAAMLNNIRKIVQNANRQKELCKKLNTNWLDKARCIADINLSVVKFKEREIKKMENNCKTKKCKKHKENLLQSLNRRKDEVIKRLEDIDRSFYKAGS